MPNCDFYGLRDDATDLLRYIFSQPGWRLYELASRHDADLRSFESAEAVLEAFDLSTTARFNLHCSEMGGAVHARRIDFHPGAVPNATFRYASEGWGLIQLHLEAAKDGALAASHTNHNSRKRAQSWEPTYADAPDRVADWDWDAVTRISRRLNRQIHARAVATTGSRQVLPEAHRALLAKRLVLV